MMLPNKIPVRLGLVVIGSTLIAIGSYHIGKKDGKFEGLHNALEIIRKEFDENETRRNTNSNVKNSR